MYSTTRKEVAALQAILQRMSTEAPVMLRPEANIRWVTGKI